MERKYTISIAILNTAILYLDIVLKIIFSFFGKTLIYIDYFWLVILLIICALGWLLHFKASRRLITISYISSWIPVIIFLSYWITLGMTSFEEENWGIILTYMVSEIMLFLPIYVLEAINLKNSY